MVAFPVTVLYSLFLHTLEPLASAILVYPVWYRPVFLRYNSKFDYRILGKRSFHAIGEGFAQASFVEKDIRIAEFGIEALLEVLKSRNELLEVIIARKQKNSSFLPLRLCGQPIVLVS